MAVQRSPMPRSRVPPTFRTARLTLRPRVMGDLEACLAMDRDAEVARFIDGPWSDPAVGEAAHRAFIEARIRHDYPAGMGYWSMLAPEFVGWVLLTPLDLVGPEIEIGWRVVRQARGRGYATEGARRILDHGLHGLGLAHVVADIDAENAASLAVAGKLGMRAEPPACRQGRHIIRHIAGA